MSSFQDAIAAAGDTLAITAGVEVTYRRGDACKKLTAIPGQSTFTVDEGFGALVKIRSRDYLIAACELVLSGSQATPQRGDLIEEKVGTKTHVHEVLRPDGADQVWRYSDSGRTRIRVHTKLKAIQ